MRTECSTLQPNRKMTATQIIVIGFISLILVGALLLSLPISSVDGKFTSFPDALFTATSATCVTGLSTVTIHEQYNLFGQSIMLVLIQIGGLGFMTMTVLFSLAIRRTITPRERIVIAQSMNLNSFGGIVKLVKRVITATFVFESIGAAILAIQFYSMDYGIGKSIYFGIFHSVSAFCNAGFDLISTPDAPSLQGISGNYVILITLMLLIVIGGLGFVVWNELYERIKYKKRLSAYSRFVLILTAILILSGLFIFLLFEWQNKATMGNMTIGEKILNSLFQSISTRTAGFAAISQGDMDPASRLVTMILMFIGGGSGSTAGGIKLGTFGILILTAYFSARGENDVKLFKRRVSHNNVMRAIAITGICISSIVVCSLLITVIEFSNTDITLEGALFECFSAFGTVGLTYGITPELNVFSQMILVLLMFFGRVGILTVTFSLSLKLAKNNSCIRYPETNFMIG